MTDAAWKQAERRCAKLFGGTRNALSGSNSGVTSADVRDARGNLYIEVKHSKSYFSQAKIRNILYDTEEKADKEGKGKVPIVVTHEKGSKEMTCWMTKTNLDKLCGSKIFFLVGIDSVELSRLLL